MVRPNANGLGGRLDQVRELLQDAKRAIREDPPDLAELHAGVDGFMRAGNALADLVAAVMRQAPAAFADHRNNTVLRELLADLRAVHGGLTAGPRLLAPAREDLQQLLDRRDRSGWIAMYDDKPIADVVDQRRPAREDDTDVDRVDELAEAEVLEADPADVADQRRIAPVLTDEETWP